MFAWSIHLLLVGLDSTTVKDLKLEVEKLKIKKCNHSAKEHAEYCFFLSSITNPCRHVVRKEIDMPSIHTQSSLQWCRTFHANGCTNQHSLNSAGLQGVPRKNLKGYHLGSLIPEEIKSTKVLYRELHADGVASPTTHVCSYRLLLLVLVGHVRFDHV